MDTLSREDARGSRAERGVGSPLADNAMICYLQNVVLDVCIVIVVEVNEDVSTFTINIDIQLSIQLELKKGQNTESIEWGGNRLIVTTTSPRL